MNDIHYQTVLGIYYDDLFAVDEKDLRSSACLILGDTLQQSRPVEPSAPMQALHLPADTPVFEIYLNEPQTTPTELLVDIYLPI
jgi:DNA gyrase inhibitor GyrI